MKLQGWNLSIEMRCEYVKLLHSETKLFNPFISDIETHDRLFDENTLDPVIRFRRTSENHDKRFEGRESSTTPPRIQGKLIITCCQKRLFYELAINQKKGGQGMRSGLHYYRKLAGDKLCIKKIVLV